MTADPTQAAQTGETLSFGYAANTGENQYLSCVLTPDDSTDVLYYNKLVELSDTAAASGTVNIPLTGVSDGNYTLRLYTEQENNRSTDFASRAVNVKITVKDGVASIRDLGNIQLVGDSGGQDGREVELRTNEETRQIQWKYTDEPDTAWRDLVALDAITGGDGADGADGREVELQVANGYIQWRYTTGADTDWKNLMPLSDLKGEDGEDGREVELKMTAAASFGAMLARAMTHGGLWLTSPILPARTVPTASRWNFALRAATSNGNMTLTAIGKPDCPVCPARH